MGNVTKSNEVDLKKKAVIEIYQQKLGNVTETCKMIPIARKTFYEWMKNDPKFKEDIENVEPDELLVDVAECAALKRIREGSDTMIIFTLKTKGKARGYVERSEVVQSNTDLLTLLSPPKDE